MRTSVVWLTLAGAMGCGRPAATPLPTVSADTVVLWGVSQFLWGDELLLIERDGRVDYGFEPSPHGQRGVAIRRSARIPPADLESLHRELAAHHLCQLRSKRNGIPDEGMPTVSVRFPDLTCEVTLWDGEWNDEPDAKACADAIMRIRAGLKEP